MANRYGVDVRIEKINRPGPDGYSTGRTVVLADDLYAPRRNFIFCHELAHILLEHTNRTTKRRKDEQDADRFAVDLMLPEPEFRENMAKFDFFELRKLYPHASWEVVARRWIQFRPAVLTIYDNGLLKIRTASEGINYPPRPAQPELKLLRQTIELREHLSLSDPPLQMNSYFIDEGKGVERVILLTEIEEFAE